MLGGEQGELGAGVDKQLRAVMRHRQTDTQTDTDTDTQTQTDTDTDRLRAAAGHATRPRRWDATDLRPLRGIPQLRLQITHQAAAAAAAGGPCHEHPTLEDRHPERRPLTRNEAAKSA